jgi:hypothetical protein
MSFAFKVKRINLIKENRELLIRKKIVNGVGIRNDSSSPFSLNEANNELQQMIRNSRDS